MGRAKLTATGLNYVDDNQIEHTVVDLTKQSLISKFPLVDIRAYGAKGDGVYDDAQAITAALNEIGANESTLLIPIPIYLMSDVTIPENVCLKFTKGGKCVVETEDIKSEQIGVGDTAGTTTFYLSRTPVLKDSEKIYVDGVLQTRDTDYAIDYETGEIVFTTAPSAGAVITADYTHRFVLTIDGGIQAELFQIFSGNGKITGSPKIEAVYPEWFGAKGDGMTDDAPAFHKLIEFAENAVRRIALQSKTYLLASYQVSTYILYITFPVVIEGNGTVIKKGQTGYCIVIEGTDVSPLDFVEISNLEIDGNSLGLQCLTINYAKKVILKNVKAHNTSSDDCISIARTEQADLTNIEAYTAGAWPLFFYMVDDVRINGFRGYNSANNVDVIDVKGSSNIFIRNVVITGSARYGIRIRNNGVKVLKTLLIENADITSDWDGISIEADQTDGTTSDIYCVMLNNIATKRIEATGYSTTPIKCIYVNNLKAEDWGGDYATAFNYAELVKIENSYFDIGFYGICNAQNCKLVIVEGNVIKNIGAGSTITRPVIRIYNTEHLYVKNNLVEGGTYTGYLVEDDSTSKIVPVFENNKLFNVPSLFNGDLYVSFPDGDTAPSVANGNYFKTVNTNTAGTAIIEFKDGIPGQRITVIFTDGLTTVVHNSASATHPIILKGGINAAPPADSTMEFVFDGSKWYEVSRSF